MTKPQSGNLGSDAQNSPQTIGAPLALWLKGIVLLGILLLAAGAAVSLVNPALLVSPGAQVTPAVRVYAGYTFSRDLALALTLLVALILRARAMLSSLMLLVGCIQLLDVIPDCLDHRYAIIPGTLVIAALFLTGAAKISGAPFWKMQAWNHTV